MASLAARRESTSGRGATPRPMSATTTARNVHASSRRSSKRSAECAKTSRRPQKSEKYIRSTASPVRAAVIRREIETAAPRFEDEDAAGKSRERESRRKPDHQGAGERARTGTVQSGHDECGLAHEQISTRPGRAGLH